MALGKCGGSTSLEKLWSVQVAEDIDQLRDDAGPARLMAGSKARAIVTVEIFVEQEVIFPLRIVLKFLCTAVHRPPARPISQKDPSEPMGDVPGHLEQVHDLARTGWTLDFESVAVIQIERHQGADQQGVHGHPYRTAPVGVATEHAGVRFCRQIVHPIFLSIHIEEVRMLGMGAGERPYPVWA